MEIPKKVYVIGICGKTTAAVANMFLEMGCEVGGSDSGAYPPISDFLKEKGIAFNAGFNDNNIKSFNPDFVFVGGSATYALADNPETKWAVENVERVYTYPEVLREFIVKPNSVVATGAYGKGTIAAMLTWILETAGRSPSFMIGSIPKNFGSGVRRTDSDISVIEGDEYPAATFKHGIKSKFFFYNPTHLIITSLQWDHLDIFATEDAYIQNFQKLVDTLPKGAVLLLNRDGENIDKLRVKKGIELAFYSKNDKKDWRYTNIRYDNSFIFFNVHSPNGKTIKLKSNFIGEFNVQNAVAAVAMAEKLGISVEDIKKAFQDYKHLGSHQELVDAVDGIKLFTDFAHSPVKAKATLNALKEAFPRNPVRVVFDIYAPSMKRRNMLDWFNNVFTGAKKVYIPRVEVPSKVGAGSRVTGKDLAASIKKTQPNTEYIPDENLLSNTLARDVKSGDIVVFMSSGNVKARMENFNKAYVSQNK